MYSQINRKLHLILSQFSSFDLKLSWRSVPLTKSKDPYTIDLADKEFRQCKSFSDICESLKELTYINAAKCGFYNRATSTLLY